MSKKNNKQVMHVSDFGLFVEVIRSASKILESAKITFSQNGVEIYGCKGYQTRCEFMSNSIWADEEVSIVIQRLDMFCKVLMSVKDIHQDDYSDFKFIIDLPKVLFESKKFKTKFQTQNEELDSIRKWFSTKVSAQLTPIFEFTTTSDLIKRINGHSFIFDKLDDIRVYLETKDDMEKNTVFATIGNKETDLSNEITLKFGIVNAGKIADGTKLILDLEHLNMFNALQSDDIKIFLPEKFPMLVSKTVVQGKNETFFKMNVYNALLKA